MPEKMALATLIENFQFTLVFAGIAGLLLIASLITRHDGAVASAMFTGLAVGWAIMWRAECVFFRPSETMTMWQWIQATPDWFAILMMVWMFLVSPFIAYLSLTRAHRFLLDNPKKRPTVNRRGSVPPVTLSAI